jgi:precorrin-6Y C5,15-methyltransferase (decarboxylating)
MKGDNMDKVYVVGMGLSVRDVTASQMEIIASAHILMGGRRHLDQFADLPMEKQPITGNVAETIDFIRQRRKDGRIVVLASGDPLFYGIGARIVRDLAPEQVTILPNITSIAAAFARINEPWSETALISLHGRDKKYLLLDALKTGHSAGVLTDARQSPQWLARWLIKRGVDHVKMAVLEKLGTAEEKFAWYFLDQAAAVSFDQPNVVILKPTKEKQEDHRLTLGMPDDAYLHQDGLITKSEVRAVTLAKLRLKPGMILWDLGAGSGSVGLEASVLLGAGRIIAVERHADRVARIRENARRYGVYNHETIHAKLPEGLEHLPAPDRIFIGGGGRHLTEIIQAASKFLASAGMMVVNTVLMDNLTRAQEAMQAENMNVEVVQMQIGRSREMPWSRRLEALNVVWIVIGKR